MNIFKKIAKENEKIAFFLKRTKNHIHDVIENYKKLMKYYPTLQNHFSEVLKHDASKFKNPEKEPYVELTWNKSEFGKNEPPSKEILKATQHHVEKNQHHPEFWTEDKVEFEEKNRDKLKKMVDASKIPIPILAEMVCDWKAVSDEMGNSVKTWADQNIGKRWYFTEKQKEWIYKFIEKLE